MRVIAGIRRGLKLSDFEGDAIRPTTDRVRENIFNIISPYIYDAKVLDMFAGTGAFSIEAISRGAECAILCEKSNASADIVKKNLEKANFGEQCVLKIGDSIDFIAKTDKQFDIIFLDPPYNTGLLMSALDKIAKRDVLTQNGIVIVECDDTEVPPVISSLECIKEKKYGRTHILIYKKV